MLSNISYATLFASCSPKGVDELTLFPFGAAGRDEPSDWFQSGEDIEQLLSNTDALNWLDDDGGGESTQPY